MRSAASFLFYSFNLFCLLLKPDHGTAGVSVQPLPSGKIGYLTGDTLKRRHIERLQRGECTIELGFVLTDLLTNFERVSDHCSNIAGCLLEMAHEDMDIHAYLRQVRASDGSEYNNYYDYFLSKYTVA